MAMTHTTEYTSTDQVAHYIAGLDAAVEDARLHLATVLHDADAYTGALAKWRGLRVLAREARLNAYGVACPCCDGAMEVRDGRNPWDAKTCPACKGDGRVLPDEADSVTEWGEHGVRRVGPWSFSTPKRVADIEIPNNLTVGDAVVVTQLLDVDLDNGDTNHATQLRT